MALKRRIRKLSKSEAARITGRQWLVCGECGNEEVEVPSDIGRVTCAACVQKMIAPPAGYKKTEKSDKPRGWHFKQYFEQNGVVYSKGVEVTDPEKIKALKKAQKSADTKVVAVKKPTKVAKKVTKTKPKIPRGRKNARTAK